MGFEIERFLCDVDEEFICPICSGVLEDPLQVPDCEHAFCRACITEWISRQPTCPVDQQPVTASQLRPVPRFMRNVLSRLSTSCDNAPHGCNAVLKLESLASHLVECEFNPERPVPCEAGCGLVIPKGELADHNCVRELRALIASHQEKLNDYEQELEEHKRVHQEKLNDYEQELAEHKIAHQEKLNAYKQDLAENKRVHQEKLNDYNQELEEHKRMQQEKLNDYKQELAEHKRAHQEKLNDYEQELAELKRELAELKEFKQERLLNPSTRALVEQSELEEVVRWANTLERETVTFCDFLYRTPDNNLKMRITRSLTKSGCPPHIIDDLMKNCEVGGWPPSIRSWYEGRSLILKLSNANYVCRKVPGRRAALILHCDNTHVDQHMMVKPGFIVFFT